LRDEPGGKPFAKRMAQPAGNTQAPEQRKVLALAAVGAHVRGHLRFAERLDELANFAAGLRPPGGEDVTATVSGALSRTASNLMSDVEAV
jgi:hypothetical protein